MPPRSVPSEANTRRFAKPGVREIRTTSDGGKICEPEPNYLAFLNRLTEGRYENLVVKFKSGREKCKDFFDDIIAGTALNGIPHILPMAHWVCLFHNAVAQKYYYIASGGTGKSGDQYMNEYCLSIPLDHSVDGKDETPQFLQFASTVLTNHHSAQDGVLYIDGEEIQDSPQDIARAMLNAVNQKRSQYSCIGIRMAVPWTEGTLEERLLHQSALPLIRHEYYLLQQCYQLAFAVSSMHQEGFVHGAVTIKNIDYNIVQGMDISLWLTNLKGSVHLFPYYDRTPTLTERENIAQVIYREESQVMLVIYFLLQEFETSYDRNNGVFVPLKRDGTPITRFGRTEEARLIEYFNPSDYPEMAMALNAFVTGQPGRLAGFVKALERVVSDPPPFVTDDHL